MPTGNACGVPGQRQRTDSLGNEAWGAIAMVAMHPDRFGPTIAIFIHNGDGRSCAASIVALPYRKSNLVQSPPMQIPIPVPNESPVDPVALLALTIDLAEQVAILCQIAEQPVAAMHVGHGIALLRRDHAMLLDLQSALSDFAIPIAACDHRTPSQSSGTCGLLSRNGSNCV